MYVAELDRPWRETPFLFQGFEIHTLEELDRLKSLCKHVYIETEPLYDKVLAKPRIAPAVAANNPPVNAQSRAREYIVLHKFYTKQKWVPRYLDQETLEGELPRAREIEAETTQLIFGIMDDVRFGRSIDTATAKKAVRGIVQSIIRNPDALICLSQLKDKDRYTAEHSLRVCLLALAFGRHLELSEEELNVLGIGALLHDIGKMKVPNEILNKPARLTDQEFEIMKSHVPRGVEILERTKGISPIAVDVARYHHERFDGHGYALGLRGEQIGLFGQIGAIVDCYDAITSDRAYHEGMTAHDALRKMYEWRRTDFHDKLVEQFIQCMGIYPIGSLVEMNTGSIGVVVSINRMRRLRPRVVLVLAPDKQPYVPMKVIDLMHEVAEPSAVLEIRRVLPAGAFGINPTQYLPLTA